jgi:hypothetical protein
MLFDRPDRLKQHHIFLVRHIADGCPGEVWEEAIGRNERVHLFRQGQIDVMIGLSLFCDGLVYDGLVCDRLICDELAFHEHGGIRTPDPQNRNLMLYPLSYMPKRTMRV